jgi:hypothetical protein
MITDFCVICGEKNNLHNHHIKPKSRGGGDEPENMLTLCVPHHEWIHQIKPNTWTKGANLMAEGRRKFVENGGKLGRKVGSLESESVFLEKSTTKSIIRLLEEGKSHRDIIARLKCSPKTITKVRKILKKSKPKQPKPRMRVSAIGVRV